MQPFIWFSERKIERQILVRNAAFHLDEHVGVSSKTLVYSLHFGRVNKRLLFFLLLPSMHNSVCACTLLKQKNKNYDSLISYDSVISLESYLDNVHVD